MPNSIPYLVLLAVCSTAYLWMMFRSRKYWTFPLLLIYSGMIDIFEYTIFILLNGYNFDPGILPTAYYDALLGAIISNVFTIPAIAVFVAVYRLGFVWILLFVLFLAFVEWLFLQLGVYQLHWWKIIYSAAAFILFFTLARFWLRKLMRRKKIYQFISLMMFASALINLTGFVLANLKVRLFTPGFFPNTYRDDASLGNLFALSASLIFAAIVLFICPKRRDGGSPRSAWLRRSPI